MVASETPPTYRTVIGLEVHVQLLTRSKLFCGCKTDFGQRPNSATCPVCLGLPGALPVMNRRACELALKAALALNCQIASFTKWDRKNYFYPDMPKNYQISQYDLPLGRDGWLEIDTAGGSKRVGIIRVHLEEDAGKMIHDDAGGGSLVDLNRAGTPLLEIVSQPELSSPEEARTYLEEIRLLMRELEVSDCEMQEGSLRCDANINIHVPVRARSVSDGSQQSAQPVADAPGSDSFAATPIVEVKNLNSIAAVERALRYEAQRHFDEYQANPQYRLGNMPKATHGWDDVKRVTKEQRRKEEASDYRYFPEPDLVPVTVSDSHREEIRAGLGELPAAQRGRLVSQYGLTAYDAGVLGRQGRALVAYFEDVARLGGDAKEACNWITNQVLQTLNERKQDIRQFPLTPAALAELIVERKATGLNPQRSREVYAHMLEHGVAAGAAIGALGVKVIADESQLLEIVRRAIAGNAKAVADFKAGKIKAADAIKGAVMRETKGMAKTELVQELLLKELAKA